MDINVFIDKDFKALLFLLWLKGFTKVKTSASKQKKGTCDREHTRED